VVDIFVRGGKDYCGREDNLRAQSHTLRYVKTAFFGGDPNWGDSLLRSGVRRSSSEYRYSRSYNWGRLDWESRDEYGRESEKQGCQVMNQDEFSVTLDLHNWDGDSASL
jgi:N-acetylglutamate synthase/N-acetylornithine aminotransferase